MTSKERVQSALKREPIDRIPADCAVVPGAEKKLLDYFQCSTVDELYDTLHIDMRYIVPDYRGPRLNEYYTNDGILVKESVFGYRKKYVWNGFEYNDIVCHLPLNAAENVDDILEFEWPDPDWYDYSTIEQYVENNPDIAVLVGNAGVYQFGTFLRSTEKLYMDMVLNPDLAMALFNGLVDYEYEYYKRILEAGKGKIDILRIFDDYGTQNSLQFSVGMWRQFFAENTKRLVDLAHFYGARFMQHSCGYIVPLVPEFITCGVDILDPIQVLPEQNLDIMNQKYGKEIIFHGGIDTQHLLPHGNPEEIRNTIKKITRMFEEEGGYILCTSQDIQGDVPPENVEALYDLSIR